MSSQRPVSISNPWSDNKNLHKLRSTSKRISILQATQDYQTDRICKRNLNSGDYSSLFLTDGVCDAFKHEMKRLCWLHTNEASQIAISISALMCTITPQDANILSIAVIQPEDDFKNKSYTKSSTRFSKRSGPIKRTEIQKSYARINNTYASGWPLRSQYIVSTATCEETPRMSRIFFRSSHCILDTNCHNQTEDPKFHIENTKIYNISISKSTLKYVKHFQIQSTTINARSAASDLISTWDFIDVFVAIRPPRYTIMSEVKRNDSIVTKQPHRIMYRTFAEYWMNNFININLQADTKTFLTQYQ